MKKIIFLFSTTLLLSLVHALCCILPYLALGLGLIGLPLYMSFLLPFQPYLVALQLVLVSYTLRRVYLQYRNYQPKTRAGIGALFICYIFLLIFPYYQHAQASKKNNFGKKTIQNIR